MEKNMLRRIFFADSRGFLAFFIASYLHLKKSICNCWPVHFPQFFIIGPIQEEHSVVLKTSFASQLIASIRYRAVNFDGNRRAPNNIGESPAKYIKGCIMLGTISSLYNFQRETFRTAIATFYQSAVESSTIEYRRG